MKLRTKQRCVRRILDLHDRARAAYALADIEFNDLLRACEIGETIRTRRGTFQVVDNFARSNSTYRVARVSRFELKKLGKK